LRGAGNLPQQLRVDVDLLDVRAAPVGAELPGALADDALEVIVPRAAVAPRRVHAKAGMPRQVSDVARVGDLEDDDPRRVTRELFEDDGDRRRGGLVADEEDLDGRRGRDEVDTETRTRVVDRRREHE